MKAVILAAGKGERMLPLTEKLPKPMLSVLGKPLLEYGLTALPEDVDEVVIVVKYLKNKIIDYFSENFLGKKIIYVEGSEKGTAYSFLNAKKYLEKEDRFVCMYGDECPNSQDVTNCLNYKSSILCWEVEDPQNHGVIEIDEEGYIKSLEEKPKNPKSDFIAGGVMVLTKDIFECIPDNVITKEFYLSQMISEYIKKEKTKAVIAKNTIGGISTPQDINRIEKFLTRVL